MDRRTFIAWACEAINAIADTNGYTDRFGVPCPEPRVPVIRVVSELAFEDVDELGEAGA